MTLEIRVVGADPEQFVRECRDFISGPLFHYKDEKHPAAAIGKSDQAAPETWMKTDAGILIRTTNILRAVFHPEEDYDVPSLHEAKNFIQTQDAGLSYLATLSRLEKAISPLFDQSHPRIYIPTSFRLDASKAYAEMIPDHVETLCDLVKEASSVARWYFVVGSVGYGTLPRN